MDFMTWVKGIFKKPAPKPQVRAAGKNPQAAGTKSAAKPQPKK